jgi:CHAD domain-containing protein
VRKEIKKLRAILRLGRHGFPKGSRAAEKEALRTTGSVLSEVRDADARVKILDKIFPRSRRPGHGWTALRERLGRDLAVAREESSTPARARAVRRQLEALKQRIEDEWELELRGWSTIASGLRDSYARGCDGLRLVRKDPTPENLHNWRKAVKDLWHQTRLLRRTWPPVMLALGGELKKLADALGEHHDLAVLAEWIENNFKDGACREPLEAAGRARARLEEGFLPAGRRIYAETPDEFCRRIHAYWRAWK